MKRIISILLVITFAFYLLPVSKLNVNAISEPSSISVLDARMNSIISGVYGVGKYFRNNQNKSCCFSSGSSCHGNHGGSYATNDSYCNCKVATADIAGTTGGIQCFGYARYVFYQLFGLPISTSMTNNNYTLTTTTNVSQVGQTTSSSASTVASIFSNAKKGDFIQARTSSGGSHSMIVYSITSSSVTVLECNHSGNCYISTRNISWSNFASKYPKFTVYRSNNYPSTTHIIDNNYPTNFTCYPKNKTSNTTVYNSDYSVASGHYISPGDLCTIIEVYTDGFCLVSYPTGNGNATYYSYIDNFEYEQSKSIDDSFKSIISYNGHTYEFYEINTSWQAAKDFCDSKGGYLATITSKQEQAIVSNLLDDTQAAWIGGTNETADGEWQWITGETFSYTNWREGEPNNYNGVEHYIAMYGSDLNYTWSDFYIASPSITGFIMEKEPQLVDMASYNGHTYTFYEVEGTWQSAKDFCESQGGHLATITSSKEQAVISGIIGDTYAVWLGGTDENSEGNWRWITGEKFTYSNWNSGEPNNDNGNGASENYIGMYGSNDNNRWNDYSAYTFSPTGFVMEKEPKLVDMASYNGHTYTFYEVEGTWQSAKDFCESQGGYLATITSSKEQSVISGIIGDTYAVWLGGTDENSEGNWRWITGENFTYSNWNSGEPNNDNGNGASENYIGMYGSNDNNRWNDYSAYTFSPTGFVMEKEVSLPTISGLKVSKTTNNSVTLTWNSINDANGYYIYQKINKKWSKVGKSTSNTYTISNLMDGTSFSFSVKAYKSVNGSEITSTSYPTVTAITKLPAVTGFKASKITSNSISFTWTKVENATEYILYQSVDGKWKNIGSVKSNSFTVSKLSSGTTYKFAINAYKTVDNADVKSISYPTVTVITKLPTVTGFKVKKTTSNSITLTWNKVSNAKGYIVYQSVDGKWKKIGTASSNTFTVSKLNSGTTYKFAVNAYKTVNGTNVLSVSYPNVTTSTNPATVNFTITAGSKKATLKWSKVTGATGYIVYYKKKASDSWTKLTTTKYLNYTKTGLTTGKTYYFTVKAYKSLNGKTYNGSYISKSVKIK